MPFSTQLSSDERRVHTKFNRAIEYEEGVDCIERAARLAQQAPPDLFRGFVFDFRGTSSGISAANVLFFVREDVARHSIYKATRIAILKDPDDVNRMFFVIAGKNAGYAIQAFSDEAAARRWVDIGF